jgi:hypothetical protein
MHATVPGVYRDAARVCARARRRTHRTIHDHFVVAMGECGGGLCVLNNVA